MNYFEVAPLSIVRAHQDTFTYSSSDLLSIGDIVTISIGKKLQIGIVVKNVVKPSYSVKEISSVLDLTSLPTPLIDTATWISKYYSTPLAHVLRAILPSGIQKKRRTPKITARNLQRQRTNFVLNTDQKSAISSISKMPAGSAILHGVTGSGKTAIYIELAKQSLAGGKSAIILVPEISLTSQLVAEFSNHFADITVVHSEQSESERHTTWSKLLIADQPQVVIGPRSALFSPLKSVGLIVVDECHEPTYKQEQQPRYSALRVASILGANHGAKVIFGSATPTVSEYYLAQSTSRPIISLPRQARTDTVAPTITTIDMTKRDNFHRHRFFSDSLLASIDSQTDKEQTLIYHNRRGTASTTLCEQCGWQAGCSRCFIPLSLHADKHQLLCHICGFSAKVPTSCPECRYADIIHKGIGTKLIESELRKLFPDKKIARFDGDVSKDDSLASRYQEIYDGTIDIIVGTQVVAKGLDLPHLRNVGIIQADNGLAIPDYTSAERTFQLLYQAIGRVGRSHHPTRVIAQTFQPNHPAVVDGLARNYQQFYDRTIALRHKTNFPPFCFLLKLTCSYKTELSAITNAKKLAVQLQDSSANLIVMPPMPAFYERLRDSYRWQIIVKSSSRQALVDALSLLPSSHWQYELDPVSLL